VGDVDECASGDRGVVPKTWRDLSELKPLALWEEIVGPDIADRLQPVRFVAATGTLVVQASSQAWCTQARIPKDRIWARLQHEGCVVADIVLLPPDEKKSYTPALPVRLPPAPGAVAGTRRQRLIAPEPEPEVTAAAETPGCLPSVETFRRRPPGPRPGTPFH
jgi:hypothetical protein